MPRREDEGRQESTKEEGSVRIPNVPGEFSFKALIHTSYTPTTYAGWRLSDHVFFSLEEAKEAFPNSEIKWPVEVWEDGSVYVATEEEWKEE